MLFPHASTHSVPGNSETSKWMRKRGLWLLRQPSISNHDKCIYGENFQLCFNLLELLKPIALLKLKFN